MSNAANSPNDLNIIAIMDNHRWKLGCISITGCTLSVCVFGRSLYEQHKRKALSWDNGLSLKIFAIVMQVLAITPVRAESQLKMATALFVLSKSLSSTYVLLLLRRIGNQVVRPILTHFTIVVVAVAIIASALGVAAPLAGCVISETASEAFCHPMEPVFLAAIAFDIFKGIWIFAFSTYVLVFPSHSGIPIARNLRRRMLPLAFVFLGLTYVPLDSDVFQDAKEFLRSTVIRTYVLVQIANPHHDLTRNVATGITWS
ncbi:unnamed protein product [Colletotrichum noveboracense]|uniref:Integral membrane protein n=1 Tax=Colletotrichum noveboracense TaxID=2664923 RepID=A0A9W4WMS9_9PEZI|nr:unnamed protein product [Colletotrichum noveboracense]